MDDLQFIGISEYHWPIKGLQAAECLFPELYI